MDTHIQKTKRARNTITAPYMLRQPFSTAADLTVLGGLHLITYTILSDVS